ncbi:MAG: hypothetical protein ACLS7Z_00625 [Christensenellales bacterium]
MDILCCALALLGGVIGAGFASGREIVRFFAAHGAMGFIAVAFALAALLALFALLPIRLAAEGQTGLSGLCRARFGARVGGVCGALFFSAVTGGAMLAACAELSAPFGDPPASPGFAVTLPPAALRVCARAGRRRRRAVRSSAHSAHPAAASSAGRSLLSAGRAAGRRSPRGAGRHALRRAERRHDGGRAAHAADPVRAAAAGVRRARRPALRRHADAGHARLQVLQSVAQPLPSSGSAAASAGGYLLVALACMRRRCPPCAPCSAQ